MDNIKNYEWLAVETGPRMLIEALKEIGVIETAGNANTPKIISWAKEVGGKVGDVFKADSIPWCGLFMAVIAKRAGKELPKDPLWALNWGTFGNKKEGLAQLGDVLVFVRKTPTGQTAGHVALYIGEDKTHYHCLGGNQSDSVCITRMPKNRLYAVREPHYNNKPKNIRTIRLKAIGSVSKSEQ